MTSSEWVRTFIVFLFITTVCLAAERQEARSEEKTTKIEWTDDLPGALATAGQDRKPLVICFVADWCSACAEFKRDALASPEVNALAGRFVWVLLDVERNVSIARASDIRAIPRTDLRDSEGNTWVSITGALPAKDFRKQLDLFLSKIKDSTATAARDVDGSHYSPIKETPTGFRGLSICYSNVGYGPLRLSSQSPFQSLRFGIDPRTPSTLAEGQWEAHLTETWSNTFVYKAGEVLLDYEMLDTKASIAYGILDELELELGFENRSAFGGIMDRFINAFHRAFGLTDAGRHNFPRNQFEVQIADKNGTPAVSLDDDDKGAFSDSLSLTLQHNVTCGTEYIPAIAYAVTLRIPLDNTVGLEGGLPVEPQLSLSVSKGIGDFYLYLSGAFGYFGTQHQDAIKYRSTQLSGLAALEWRFASRMSLTLQYLATQGEVQSLGPFSTNSHEITLGWKWEFASNVVSEIGLIENLINFENSPDFGIHAGLTLRF